MKALRTLTLLCITAAAFISASAQNTAPPRVPGLDTAGMDRSARPQDDFFRFVNGAWVDKTAIPPDRSNYGSFAMLTERAQEALRGILEGESMNANPPGSIGQKVGGFYKSFMDEARIDARGIEPLKGELAAIDAIAGVRDFPVVFGRLSREPAADRVERAAFRGPLALYTGWVSLATVLGTAATGVWVGLPGDNALAAIAAVVVLLAAAGIVAWVVLSGTAVVPYAAAVVWALIGIALNSPPAAVVIACAIAIVIVLATTLRRVTTAGSRVRAAWG